MPDTNETPYLTRVKAELRAIFDEAFKYTWEAVEARLKESYANGVRDGKAGKHDDKADAPSPRRWSSRRKKDD